MDYVQQSLIFTLNWTQCSVCQSKRERVELDERKYKRGKISVYFFTRFVPSSIKVKSKSFLITLSFFVLQCPRPVRRMMGRTTTGGEEN